MIAEYTRYAAKCDGCLLTLNYDHCSHSAARRDAKDHGWKEQSCGNLCCEECAQADAEFLRCREVEDYYPLKGEWVCKLADGRLIKAETLAELLEPVRAAMAVTCKG